MKRIKQTFLAFPALFALNAFALDNTYAPLIVPRGGMNGSGGCAGHGFPRTHEVFFATVPPQQGPGTTLPSFFKCRVLIQDGNTSGATTVLADWQICGFSGYSFSATNACASYSVESVPVYRTFNADGTFTDRFGRELSDSITWYAD